MRRLETALLAGALVFVAATPVRADVAADVQAELQAAGLPNPTVAVTSPAPATIADFTTYQQNPGVDLPSISPENLMSPDPTAPQPLLSVGFGQATVTALPGIFQTTALDNWYSTEDAEFPLWRLQIMSALKHALARGTVLTGVKMMPSFPNRAMSGTADFYATPPDPQDLPPTGLPQTMPASTAETAVEQELPTWARTADVQVTDWAGGERRATMSMTVVPAQLVQFNPQDLVVYLLDQQLSLNESGANIGSVVLRIRSLTGEPLFSFAGDATWGQFFTWVGPQVRAWVPSPLDDSVELTERDAADEVDRLRQEAPMLP